MKRIETIDLAKGFAVLTLAPVHTLMVFGTPEAQESVLGAVLYFLAEGPGAQIFMLLMGASFVFSSRKSLKALIKKAALILLAGYVLNALKFVLPMFAGALPPTLLNDLAVANNSHGRLLAFLTGDILQFAAPVLILLFFVCKLPYYQWCSLALAVIVCLLSPYMWDWQSSNFWVNYCFQLIGGQHPRVFFPLFPWLVYPLVGIFIGHYLKAQYTPVIKWMAMAGLLLLFIPFDENISFYRTRPTGTLVHLGITLVWLYLWHLLATYVKANYFFSFLKYLSQNITSIYFIQWVFILWLVPFIGYLTLGLASSFCCIVIVTACVLMIQKIMDLRKKVTELQLNSVNEEIENKNII